MPKKRSRKQGTKKARKRASEPSPSRWEVKVVLEALDEATFYVSGRDQAEAERPPIASSAGAASTNLSGSGPSTRSRSRRSNRTTMPTRLQRPTGKGSICKMCLRAVRWTGIAADDPGTGAARPFPVHGSMPHLHH